MGLKNILKKQHEQMLYSQLKLSPSKAGAFLGLLFFLNFYL